MKMSEFRSHLLNLASQEAGSLHGGLASGNMEIGEALEKCEAVQALLLAVDTMENLAVRCPSCGASFSHPFETEANPNPKLRRI